LPERDTYADVGAAIRQAHERACEAGDLTARDWRILSAVLTLVASYSRMRDRLTSAQVAAAAGVHERTAQKCLTRLRDRGIIMREASVGRRPSVTGFHAAEPRPTVGVVEASRPRPTVAGVEEAQPRPQSPLNPAHRWAPTREDLREEGSARASEAPPPGLAGGQPSALGEPDETPPSWEAVVEQLADVSEPMRVVIRRAVEAQAARQLELRVDDAGDELARRDAQRRRGEMSGSGATARPTGPPGQPLTATSDEVSSTGGPA